MKEALKSNSDNLQACSPLSMGNQFYLPLLSVTSTSITVMIYVFCLCVKLEAPGRQITFQLPIPTPWNHSWWRPLNAHLKIVCLQFQKNFWFRDKLKNKNNNAFLSSLIRYSWVEKKMGQCLVIVNSIEIYDSVILSRLSRLRQM